MLPDLIKMFSQPKFLECFNEFWCELQLPLLLLFSRTQALLSFMAT